MAKQKGFLEALFDFSFSRFITVTLAKIMYGLCILVAAIYALFLIVMGFNYGGSFFGVIMLLIIAPLWFFFMVIASRVWLEAIIVLFRIFERVDDLAVKKGATGKPSSQAEEEPSQS
jgi:uncharacterized membrane protein